MAEKKKPVTPATDPTVDVSSDHQFSTIRPATADELDLADPNLPPGPIVVQELGVASESEKK